MLNLLADYTQGQFGLDASQTLLVYPGIVLLASLAFRSPWLLIYGYVTRELTDVSGQLFPGPTGWQNSFQVLVSLWYPVVLSAAVLAVCSDLDSSAISKLVALALPAFKEASFFPKSLRGSRSCCKTEAH